MPTTAKCMLHMLPVGQELRALEGHHKTPDDHCASARRWLDIDKPWVDNPAFIVHFAGCGMCSSGFHPERLGECDVEYIRIFAESFGHLKDTGALNEPLVPFLCAPGTLETPNTGLSSRETI